MKIAILGAAGLRTPLIVRAIKARQDRLGVSELALMDIDLSRLKLIGALTAPIEEDSSTKFRVIRTKDAESALTEADYVITTFRVGGMEARIIDERVPLSLGCLGQETTGAGGFAMGMRSIPVLLGYVEVMRRVCPRAWLINFANPSGMLAEAAQRVGGWERTVGICDAPASMLHLAAALLQAPPDEVFLDYFGLNHLGWARSVVYREKDHLPDFIQMLRDAGQSTILPFDAQLLTSLGMIPNEYLYYYYYRRQAVDNILRREQTRGEQVLAANEALFGTLIELVEQGQRGELEQVYQSYLKERSRTYMIAETGVGDGFGAQIAPALASLAAGEGYADVALDLIEALNGGKPRRLILNIPNRGAVHAMADDAVVEIPAFVSRDAVQPLVVGRVPDHCLGLMQQVKAYEHLTIEAAVEKSYAKAQLALTLHPLVGDYELAGRILSDYIEQHGEVFPRL